MTTCTAPNTRARRSVPLAAVEAMMEARWLVLERRPRGGNTVEEVGTDGWLKEASIGAGDWRGGNNNSQMQQQQQLQKAAMHARSAATTRPIAQPPATPVSLLPVPVPPLPTPVPTPVASP
uniref:Uncharacterized protein n=1 Tax=Oryza meridionalis TaxID=40149 RepID=A0A0E0EPN9_9ORYZ